QFAISFPIVTDTFMDSRTSNTGKNYGAATTTKVLINSSDGSVCRGLFQLPSELSVYATSQIAKATVLFYVWQDNTTNLDITLFPLSHSFVEGTGNGTMTADGAAWNTYDGLNAWSNPGGDFDTNYPVVGVKEKVLDPDANDRFFSWDITALLTNETARTELLAHGALLQIDEVPPPASGMPRAPFTSSDDLSYAETYRPHVELLVMPRTASVSRVSMEGEAVTLIFSGCTPYVTNRIERNFDLQQPGGWTLVTNIVTLGSDTNWTESFQPDWTNAYYRILCGE
ncbi:MAG: hypothetical protein V2A34_16545, partial [Lentisphaerota bacterium]